MIGRSFFLLSLLQGTISSNSDVFTGKEGFTGWLPVTSGFLQGSVLGAATILSLTTFAQSAWTYLISRLPAVVSRQWSADIPQDVTAQNGLCARIPCHYRYPSHLNNKPRTGIWYKSEMKNPQSVAFHSGNPSLESTKFQNRTRLSGILLDNDCSLVIYNVTQQDAGPYYFRVEFTSGWLYSYTTVTQLHVTDFTNKPTILPAEMVAGRPVTVACFFSTTCDGTAPTLTWVTPADEPTSASHSVTQRGDTLTYTSVLYLTPALKHHGQNLTCRVRYPTGSSEQNLTMTVQYAPQNLSITYPNNVNNSWVSVKEGNSAAILCSVQSFPACNLTWRHLSVTLNTTRSSNELWMEFPQLTRQDAGVYQCVAENEHGTAERDVTLTVEYAPRNLSITFHDVANSSRASLKEGNSGAILCSVQSFPASNLTWEHLGFTLNTTHSSNELWMEFPQLTRQDAGVYQCVAENEHGTAERDVTLTVEYAPMNLSITSHGDEKSSRVSVKEGNSAAILCSVQSFPASNLTWEHLGITLSTTRSNNELWVEFPQLTRQDAGVYQCVAENEHGTAERDVTLTVEYAPEISRYSGCNRTPESVTCVCAARCNPPGELTWHLPLANLSGNQTRGHLHTLQVAGRHLVNGSLTLRGGDVGEDMMALCSVRKRHGEAMFTVYLSIEGKSFSIWIAVSLTAGIILIAELAGFFICKYIQRREDVTMEKALRNQGTNVTNCPHSPINQSAGSGEDAPAPEELKGGGESGEGEDQAVVYASLRGLPSNGNIMHSGEGVEYAELWFQSKHGEGEGEGEG